MAWTETTRVQHDRSLLHYASDVTDAEARHLIRQRDEIERAADTLPGDNSDYRRLCQLPGIGPTHGLVILAEAGDLRRFPQHRQFLKYCGFDLATHQSGQFRGQTRLSKYGNARLSRAFWMAGKSPFARKTTAFRPCR